LLWERGAPNRVSADGTPITREGQSENSVGPPGARRKANQIGLDSATPPLAKKASLAGALSALANRCLCAANFEEQRQREAAR